MPSKHLIALAFTFNALIVAFYPSFVGAVVSVTALSFTGFLVWLDRMPKDEPVDLSKLRAEIEAVKDKVDKVILGGRRGQ